MNSLYIYVFFVLLNNLCKMGLSLSWSFGKICLENYLDLVGFCVFMCVCIGKAKDGDFKLDSISLLIMVLLKLVS